MSALLAAVVARNIAASFCIASPLLVILRDLFALAADFVRISTNSP